MGVTRDAAQYAAQLRALLPPGPAWDAELAPEIAAILGGVSQELARLDARAGQIQDEMNAGTVSELVPDWERVMGLPDPCLGPGVVFSDRRLSVRRRLLAVGEQTPAYFVELAATQGYKAAQVSERRAPRFGRSRFGRGRFGTWAAQFMWALDTGPRQAFGRRFGVSYWGERFGANPGAALNCLIERHAPAHTVPSVNYE